MPVGARLRPTPALIVASVALLVALGGTSAAAVALLPRNSVGSSQVIDGSIRAKDLSRDALPAPVELFSRSVAGPVLVQVGDDDVPVAKLQLPDAGTYVIWAKARLTLDDTGITCEVVVGDRVDTSGASVPSSPPGGAVTTTLTNVVVQELEEPGSVELRCGTSAKGKRIAVRDITLAALEVENATTS